MTVEPSPSRQWMQKSNRLRVLDLIRRASGGISRPELARRTGLSLASITNIVSYLKAGRWVREVETDFSGRVGRKASLLVFTPTSRELIAARVEPGCLKLARLDLAGAIRNSQTCVFPTPRQGFDIDRLRAELGRFVRREASQETLAIGVAVSGLVLGDGETVLSAALRWEASGLNRLLTEDTGLPVVVCNSSAAHALAACAATDSMQLDNVLFIDLDGGIGAVQITGGRVNPMLAGEIGHTTVEKSGDRCFCGNHGCLELYVSPERLIELACQASGRRKLTLAQVFTLAANQPDVQAALEETLEYLGIGAANMVNMTLPSRMILNYAWLHDFDLVHAYVQESIRRRAYGPLSERMGILRCPVTDSGKWAGIAAYTLDAVLAKGFAANPIE